MVSKSVLCYHLQAGFPGWKDDYRRAHDAGSPFRALKAFQVEKYNEMMEVSPRSAFVFRHWINNQEPYVYHPDPLKAAHSYLDHFADSLNQHIGQQPAAPVYIESLNEEYPTANRDKLMRIVGFDRAFIRALGDRFPRYRPIVFTAAVGNPGHNEYGALVQLARDTAAAGGAFGYHGYHTVHRGHSFVEDPRIMRDLHMRWLHIDRYMRDRGIVLDWFLGEIGATFGQPDGYGPSDWAGWKQEHVWNGDTYRYMIDLEKVDRLIRRSGANVIAAAVFTANPNPSQWKYYRTVGSMARRITDHVAADGGGGLPEPGPGPEPIPESETIAFQKHFRIRTEPNLQATIVRTGWPGLRVDHMGIVEGEEWRGDRRWRQIVFYAHEQAFE